MDKFPSRVCCKISQTPRTDASLWAGEGSVSAPVKQDTQPEQTVQLLNMAILQREMVNRDLKPSAFGSITTESGGVPSQLPTSVTLAATVVRIGCPNQTPTPFSLTSP